MHGLEVEQIVDVTTGEISYITPFVGKDTPWWNNLTNKNKYTNQPYTMQATVIESITLDDIKKYTNVDNTCIEKKPYYYDATSNNFSNNVFYLSRTDNNFIVNDNVSSRYKIIQHSYSLERAEELRGKFSKLSYYSSGVLFGGTLFWVQLEQDAGYVVNDDKVLLTLIFLSNHAGSNCIYTTIQRVVCNNTLQISLSNTHQQLFVTHIGNTSLNYDQLLNAFDADSMQFQDSLEMFKYWNNIDVNHNEVEELIRYSLNLQEAEDFKDNYLYQNALRLIEEQKGVELLKGKYTAYRVFNALTEATQHIRKNRIYHALFGKVTNIIDRFKSKLNNL